MASKRRQATEPVNAGVRVPIPGRDEILARVARIAPILDRTAGDSERQRTLCAEAVTALHATGLFGLWAPTEVGGYDADLVTQLDVLISSSCGPSAARRVGRPASCRR